MLHLLLLCESWNDAENLISRLRNAGHVVRSERVEDGEDLETALQDQDWDLVLYVDHLEAFAIGDAAGVIANAKKGIPLLSVHHQFDEKVVANAMRAGARQVLPWEPEELLPLAVERELTPLEWRRSLDACRKSLQESERLCRLWLDTSNDAVAYVQEGIHLYVNPAYLKLFGYGNPDEMNGTPMMELIAPPQHAEFKKFLRRFGRSGNSPKLIEVQAVSTSKGEFPASIELSPSTIDGEPCMQVLVRDLSVDQTMRQTLESLTRMDPLTGVYNRPYLLREMVQMANEQADNVGILYIRLDNYGDIKTSAGLLGADQILKEVATILREHTGKGGSLGRITEATFLLLDRQRTKEELLQVTEIMRDAIATHIFDAAGRSVSTSCTIAVYPPGYPVDNVQSVLSRLADVWQAAHDKSPNRTTVYEPTRQQGETEEGADQKMVLRIKEALRNDRMQLRYQPIIGLRGEPGENYEVLPCLFGDDGMQIDSGTCMTAASQAGLMTAVDHWLIGHALDALAAHRAQGHGCGLFIPVSADSLQDDTLVPRLEEQLARTGVEPGAVCLQVRETDARPYLRQVMDLVTAVKLLGCKVALKVGMEQQELGHLKQLDVDFYKIDGNLVHDLSTHPEHQEAVNALSEELTPLGKWVIAEAVQDANTMALLWQYGVHYMQGDYVQEPRTEMDYDFEGG